MTGTTLTDIPGYTLLRPIGRGGMASVFLASSSRSAARSR
jgi:hypothetical protein